MEKSRTPPCTHPITSFRLMAGYTKSGLSFSSACSAKTGLVVCCQGLMPLEPDTILILFDPRTTWRCIHPLTPCLLPDAGTQTFKPLSGNIIGLFRASHDPHLPALTFTFSLLLSSSGTKTTVGRHSCCMPGGACLLCASLDESWHVPKPHVPETVLTTSEAPCSRGSA